MLKVARQHVPGKLRRLPNDEASQGDSQSSERWMPGARRCGAAEKLLACDLHFPTTRRCLLQDAPPSRTYATGVPFSKEQVACRTECVGAALALTSLSRTEEAGLDRSPPWPHMYALAGLRRCLHKCCSLWCVWTSLPRPVKRPEVHTDSTAAAIEGLQTALSHRLLISQARTRVLLKAMGP